MKKRQRDKRKPRTLRFADIFAGCGGISLGLTSSGWTGVFAIEKNKDAFATFATNLINGGKQAFDWPEWLPKEAMSTSRLLSSYQRKIASLNGRIDLLAGGPPCQGFSLAGRRIHSDPRNSLTREYLEIVRKIKPRFILIENVQGFDLPFKNGGPSRRTRGPYSKVVKSLLEQLGYKVFSELVDLSLFGVPQNRKRFILIAIRNNDRALVKLRDKSPFDLLRASAAELRRSKGLPVRRPITVKEAIADLEVRGKELVPSTDHEVEGFQQIRYKRQSGASPFVRLMHNGMEGGPDSLRLPRHRPSTIAQFAKILKTCGRGHPLRKHDRRRLGIKKQALTPLHPNRPSATITTLPDDIVHYSEPRILTVRENARIQTFPDWFRFTGQYTTGGKSRRHSCPRYTQVGNAVPPLFAEALGTLLKRIAS